MSKLQPHEDTILLYLLRILTKRWHAGTCPTFAFLTTIRACRLLCLIALRFSNIRVIQKVCSCYSRTGQTDAPIIILISRKEKDLFCFEYDNINVVRCVSSWADAYYGHLFMTMMLPEPIIRNLPDQHWIPNLAMYLSNTQITLKIQNSFKYVLITRDDIRTAYFCHPR